MGNPTPYYILFSGWIKYCEHYFPEMIDNLSTCKSPQQMFGAISKTYYADKMGIDSEKIVMVSVMPCTAKKFEIGRDDQDASGYPDVDISITTRELARMIEKVGMNSRNYLTKTLMIPRKVYWCFALFGATGGVMEAALKNCC